jgi:hypothetical protein
MSPPNDPDDLTQGGNSADSKDSSKEAKDIKNEEINAEIDNKIAQQAEKIGAMLDGKISKQIEGIKTLLDQRISILDTKLDQRFSIIEAKIDVQAKELDRRCSIIEAKIDKQCGIIETKIDAQAKEVSILQQRVNSSEADRSRLITGSIGAVLGALLILGIQKFLSSEPPRNPTNRSAIEYIP